ncbi:hypothetical protein MAHJHV61_16850 [Mycobacterium avium subsp. hominissuis]
MAKLRRLHVEHRRPGTHAGVGHHGIDATELLNAGINGRSHGVGIANIALRNHASAGPEFLCQRLHCGPIDVHEKEPCATAVQRARRACADSTAGPRDQHRLIDNHDGPPSGTERFQFHIRNVAVSISAKRIVRTRLYTAIAHTVETG